MKRVGLVLLALLLCSSCAFKEPMYETISLRTNGATLLVKCASGRIEVGLHQPSSSTGSRVNAVPINKLPLASRVQVWSADSNGPKIDKTAEKPVVFWMSERQRDRVEYIGLQEVDLPFSLGCADYIIDIDYSATASEWAAETIGSVPYVRKAMRP